MKKARIVATALALVLGASTLMAAEGGVPNRLANAKIGEWATYSVPNGYLQKLTVIKREGSGPEAQVTVRVENIYEGEVVTSTEFTRDAGNPTEPPRVDFQPGTSVAIKSRNVEVKGMNIQAIVVEIEDDDIDDEEEKWYVSAEIPVFGIVMKEENDEVVFRVVDFGEN